MRVPKIESRNIEKVKEQLLQINFYTTIDMYDDSWQIDDKSYTKFIKRIEKIVRGSIEYRDYVYFLKEELDMNQCSFFQNIDRQDIVDISIEIHHSPLTLYDICAIVFGSMRVKNNKLLALDVAEEVLKAHYLGLIGLIPLSITAHQLVHAGDIFIPVNKVDGDVSNFLKKYNLGLTDEHKELLEAAIATTDKAENYTPAVLERNIVYLKVDGMDFPILLKENVHQIA